MLETMAPEIRELERRDIDALLARQWVGRLAFARGKKIDIVPIHFVYSAGSLWGRTSPGGTIFEMSESGSDVAFEVDEVHSVTSWKSVVGQGTFHTLSEHLQNEEWLQALGLLRRFSPTVFRESDPTPHRTELFRIVVHEVTGRELGGAT